MSEYTQDRKGFWHEAGGVSTSEAIALEAWARSAHDILVATAETYHGLARESQLAEWLQSESGIRTSRPHVRWLAKVLAPLARVHHLSGEPPLTALVVDDRVGWVGERYDDVLRAAEQPPISDPMAREQHAARARLECYRWAGSVPDDGGEPAPVPTASGRVRAPRKEPGLGTGAAKPARVAKVATTPAVPAAPPRIAASDRPVTVCATCFMAIPATGLCDNCD